MFWGEHDWRVQIRGVWGKSWTSLPFAEAAKMARWSHAICLYVTYHVVPTPSYDATRHRAILAASALSVLSIKEERRLIRFSHKIVVSFLRIFVWYNREEINYSYCA